MICPHYIDIRLLIPEKDLVKIPINELGVTIVRSRSRRREFLFWQKKVFLIQARDESSSYCPMCGHIFPYPNNTVLEKSKILLAYISARLEEAANAQCADTFFKKPEVANLAMSREYCAYAVRWNYLLRKEDRPQLDFTSDPKFMSLARGLEAVEYTEFGQTKPIKNFIEYLL